MGWLINNLRKKTNKILYYGSYVVDFFHHGNGCLMSIPHSHLKHLELEDLPITEIIYSEVWAQEYDMISYWDFSKYCIKRTKFFLIFRHKNAFVKRFCKHNK